MENKNDWRDKSGIVLFVIDESGSMGGMKWRNAVNGTKYVI